MKIAVVSSVFGNPWAGSEELWYQTSLECLKQGHAVRASVFEVYKPCDQHQHLIKLGGVIDYRKRFTNGRLHVLTHKYLSEFNKLFKWNPDVIILSLGSLFDIMMYPDLVRHLKKQRNIKVIGVCLYNSDTIILNDYSRKQVADFCERVDHFVFVAKHNYLLAERQLAMKFKAVSVFSSPVSYLDSYQSLPWPQSDGMIHMASVARLDVDTKGQDVLLAALSSDKWKSRNWKLNLYGRGADESYIKQLIVFYGLQDKVSFGGFEKDTRDIWKKNHILVMASRSEGLSLALLEAMICGRICVVTNVGGHGDVITDNESGFLAEAPIPEYFEKALERAWSAQDRFAAIATKAHESAQEAFKVNPIKRMMDIIHN
jgi:L-malate glycosyltransferase